MDILSKYQTTRPVSDCSVQYRADYVIELNKKTETSRRYVARPNREEDILTAATSPHGNDTIVRVSHLTKTYDGGRGRNAVLAVNDVDLDVKRGELVVLLGPSGCGKTTLLRCVAGLEKPVHGEIRINGRTVYSSHDKTYVVPEQRRIGMMFQSYALWPHMTVFQNVAYPLASAGMDKDTMRERVLEVLDRLGVGGMEQRFPSELSGGQQQRVALARALVGSPSVILFDEPLSNIDAKVRRKLRRELRDLKMQTGFSGIYVTHDQEEAMELADTLAVMENGRIVQLATARQVYEHPKSIYVAEFVGEINRLQGRLESVSNSQATVSTPLGPLPVQGLPATAKSGDSGWVVIRPESVAVEAPHSASPLAPEAGARFTGTVQDAIYFGAKQELHLDVRGVPIPAWAAGTAWTGGHGDAVAVTLPAASLQWIPA